MDSTTALTDTESIVLEALAAVEAREEPFAARITDQAGLSPEATRSALAGLVAKDLVVEDTTEAAGPPAGDLQGIERARDRPLQGPRYRIRPRPA